MMKMFKHILTGTFFILISALIFTACQKMERPALGDYPEDPPPPPYSTLKHFWTFENNVRDTGQFRASTSAVNVSYVDGVSGKGVQIGDQGYILVPTVADSIATPGSISVAFWMKGAGPVKDGAQGLFSISNKTQFWGNFEVFLENYDMGSDAFIKIHLLNSTAANGVGEQWVTTQVKDVLNKWSHLAITYDGETSKISVYVNGEPTEVNGTALDGGNYGPLVFKDVNGMVLGSFAFQTNPSLTNHGPEGWAKSFNGALDNVRIYKVAISADDVKKLFTNKE